MKLRSKISAFLIPIIVVPMILLGSIAYSMLQDTTRTKSLEQAVTFVEQIEGQINNLARTAIANANLFTESEILKKYLLTESAVDRYALYQPALIRHLVNFQRAFPENFEIRLILPDGYEDLRVVNNNMPNRTDEELNTTIVSNVMASDADIITQVAIHPDNNQLSLHISKRIYLTDTSRRGTRDSPHLAGYIMLAISLEDILQQVFHFRIGETGKILTYSSRGYTWDNSISEYQGASDIINYMPSPIELNIVEQIHFPDGNDELFEFKVSGEQVLVFPHQIDNLLNDLWLLIWLPKKEIVLQAQSLSLIVMMTTLIMILIILVSTYLYFSRKIIRPIDNLSQVARQIGKGNLAVDVAVKGDDEIAQLAHSFEEMRINLQKSNDQIHYLAYHDNLTGLPNRLMFREYLSKLLSHAKRHKERFALIFLDLDNFKKINDSQGHEFGDQLLEEFANVLMHSLRKQDYLTRVDFERPDDIVARLGGDEFVILLPQKGEGYEASVVARRLLDSLQTPLQVSGQQVFVQVSMGITLFPQDGEVPEELIKHADIAMYHAKALGKNNYQFFSQSLNESVMQRLAIENKLRKALEEKKFFLHYQPRLCAKTQRIVAVEALIRWRDPELGMVRPDQFIPVAEETGLIVPIGEWVVEAACKQLKQWHGMGFDELNVSVNVSSIQVGKANISEVIHGILKRVDLDPASLEVELTESTMMEASQDVLKVLDEIRDIGVKIALDDFGTGYSSLNYLRRFPINNLKIDRSFVSEIETHESGQAIISGIIAMAHALNLEVIAEGVENEAQMDFLCSRACDQLQGYLLYKPMAAVEITDLLRRQHINLHLIHAKDA